MAEPSNSTESIQVSMPEVVKFVRQLAHDLRNHLNAAELQSAYLIEIAENNEVREEIRRLRGMIAQVGTSLQELTAALSPPRLTQMPYAAKELIEDLQQKIAASHPTESAQVNWADDSGDLTLNIDPQLLLPALAELFANAFRHERAEGPISAAARKEKERFIFTLSEPKRNFERSTENWGHYGLGLYRTRAIIEAHGGEFSARYEKGSGSLVISVTLPAVAPDA